MPGESKEANGSIAKGSQVLRCVPLLDLTFVFPERDISHPVQTLDAPVGLPTVHQKGRISARGRQAADRMLHLGGLLAVMEGDAFQAADLGQAGPIEMLSQSRAGLQVPFDEPSVSFARRARLRERLLPLVLGRGGKIPAETPLRSRPSTRADCL